MIGLGEVNDQLLAFERSVSDNEPSTPELAKTMMVFMVRGLFNKPIPLWDYEPWYVQADP